MCIPHHHKKVDIKETELVFECPDLVSRHASPSLLFYITSILSQRLWHQVAPE